MLSFIGNIAKPIPLTVLAFFFSFYTWHLFPLYHHSLKEKTGTSYKTLDITYGYDLEHVQSLFTSFGEEGRAIYWRIETEIDMIYPFIYNGLLIAFLFLLLGNLKPKWVKICYLPFVSLVFDLGENLMVLTMLIVKPFYINNLQVVLASLFTTIKLTVALGSTLLVVVLLVLKSVFWIRSKTLSIND